MSESTIVVGPEGPSAADITLFLGALAGRSPASCDADRVDRIAAMEALKGGLGAAQARETVASYRSVTAAEAEAGAPARRRGRDVGEQVALVRREPPRRGGRLLGLVRALCQEMPQTLAALTAGEISEWRPR